MREFTLDLTKMTSQEKAHAYLKELLHFPEYYGANLDALNDCLGEITTPTIIKIPKALADGRHLGNFGVRLVKVLRIAAEENSALQIRMIDK
jgi:RNAse (barnase) inhibitor barstar